MVKGDLTIWIPNPHQGDIGREPGALAASRLWCAVRGRLASTLGQAAATRGEDDTYRRPQRRERVPPGVPKGGGRLCAGEASAKIAVEMPIRRALARAFGHHIIRCDLNRELTKGQKPAELMRRSTDLSAYEMLRHTKLCR